MVRNIFPTFELMRAWAIGLRINRGISNLFAGLNLFEAEEATLTTLAASLAKADFEVLLVFLF